MNHFSLLTGFCTILAFVFSLGVASAADVVWTNPAGGNWGVVTNWSTGAVPGAGDRALITLAGTYTVTLNVNATLAGLELGASGGGKQTLVVNNSARTLTLNGPSSVVEGGLLRLTSGTITGTGELTIADEMEWTGGTLTGSGGTVIPAGGNLKLSGTASKTLNGRTIQNSGTVQLDGTGTLAMSGNALIENQASGLIEVLSDANLTSSGTPRSTLHNLGTFKRTSGNDVVNVTAGFDNEGRVEVLSGTLQVSGTGLSSGVFDMAASTILRMSANYGFSATAAIQGAGRSEFTGGTVSIDGTYNLTGGTTVSGSASVNFGGAVLAVGNTLTVGGSTAAANFTTNALTLTDVTLTGGTLANAASMVINGAFAWSGGTLGGSGHVSISPTGSLNLSGTPARQLVSRVLEVQGAASWIGASTLTMSGGSEFNIQSGATFDVRGDPLLTTSGTPRSVLNIRGTLLRSTSLGNFRVGCDCNNSGTNRVTSGTLVLQGGGTGSGEFNGTAGTMLRFAADYTLTEASHIVSSGTVDFNSGTIAVPGTYELTGGTLASGATVSFSGPAPAFGGSLTVSAGSANLGVLPVSIPKVTLSGGTISGTGVLTITENLSWTGGTFGGIGTTLVTSGATLALSGTATKTLSARTLSVAGAATWVGTGTVALNTQAAFGVEAGGTLELQGDSTLSSSGSPASTFNNAGTVIRNTGAGTFTISAPCKQTGLMEARSGTLRFTSSFQQTAGTMRLAGGAFSTSSFLDVRGGTLTGSGTINGVVRNSESGVIHPSSQMQIIAPGGWTNGPGGVIEVELRGTTPATDYDQLATTGRATLNGIFRVKLAPGYQPVIGDSFEILRFVSSAGAFGGFDGILVSPDLYLLPSFTSTNLVLKAIAVPKPVFGAPQMLPGGNFRLRISEVTGLNVIVDATQDFSTWEPISTNLNCPVLLEVIDTGATNYPQRFYRARLN